MSGKQGEEPSAKRQLIRLLFAGSVYRITMFRRGLGLVWFRVPIIPDLPTMPTSAAQTEPDSSLCLPDFCPCVRSDAARPGGPFPR
jgi:hypothetical protein